MTKYRAVLAGCGFFMMTGIAHADDAQANPEMVAQMRSAVARIAQLYGGGDYGFVVSNVDGFAAMVRESLARTAEAAKLEEDLANLRRTLVMTRNNVTEAEAKIEGLRSRKESFDRMLAELEARELEVGARIAEKSKEVARADAAIAEKTEALARLETMVAQVEETIGVAEDRMEETSANLRLLATKENAMRQRITAMQDALMGAHTLIAGVMEPASVSGSIADASSSPSDPEISDVIEVARPGSQPVTVLPAEDDMTVTGVMEVDEEAGSSMAMTSMAGDEPDMIDVTEFTQRLYGKPRSKQ